MTRQLKKYSTSKKVYLTALLVLLLVALMATLELTNTTHLFHKITPVSTPATSNVSSTKDLPSKSVNSGDKTSSTSASANQGSVTDKNGSAPSITSDSSKWSVSTSGAITVKQPLKNDVIASGVNLVGTSTTDQVQYRLIDNQTGVISQGPVNVVNGVFSANISLQSQSKSGRLDVFSTDSYGREINEVQILINF